MPDWPFGVLGLINGACALAIGWIGAPGVAAMRGVDETIARATSQSVIKRTFPLELVYFVASLIGVALALLG
jgi:hypothetical protein